LPVGTGCAGDAIDAIGGDRKIGRAESNNKWALIE